VRLPLGPGAGYPSFPAGETASIILDTADSLGNAVACIPGTPKAVADARRFEVTLSGSAANYTGWVNCTAGRHSTREEMGNGGGGSD